MTQGVDSEFISQDSQPGRWLRPHSCLSTILQLFVIGVGIEITINFLDDSVSCPVSSKADNPRCMPRSPRGCPVTSSSAGLDQPALIQYDGTVVAVRLHTAPAYTGPPQV